LWGRMSCCSCTWHMEPALEAYEVAQSPWTLVISNCKFLYLPRHRCLLKQSHGISSRIGSRSSTSLRISFYVLNSSHYHVLRGTINQTMLVEGYLLSSGSSGSKKVLFLPDMPLHSKI
jgi:hypothetical protein